jgi:hypothetical protein
MIVVEASHAHVMKFLPLSANCHFLGEKGGNGNFIYFFKIND